MDQYLNPPENLKIDDYIPFLKYILAGVMVLGAMVTVASVIYLSVCLIKAIFGFSGVKNKYIDKAFWGMFIGLMLFCGGWLGVISFFKAAMFPTHFF